MVQTWATLFNMDVGPVHRSAAMNVLVRQFAAKRCRSDRFRVLEGWANEMLSGNVTAFAGFIVRATVGKYAAQDGRERN